MTQKTAPRLSIVGGLVASLVLAAGTVVMPALACPPDEDQVVAAKAKKEKDKAPTAVTVTGKAAKTAKAPKAADAPAVPFLPEAPALEAMKGAKARPGQPMPPTPPQPATAPRPPAGAFMGTSPTVNLARNPGQPAARAEQPTTVYTDLEALKVGATAKVYKLPKGKLTAFYGLMSRNDIPILVELHDDSITIWANDSQHATFESLFKIINPDGNAKGEGAGAATRLDVFSAPGQPARAPGAVSVTTNPFGGLTTVRTAKPMNKAAIDEYRKALKEVESHRKQMEAEAERVRGQADHVRDRAEQMKELAEQLRERAAETGEAQDKAALEQALRGLVNRSDSLRSQHKSMEERVSQIERQLEDLERRAEKLEEDLSEAEDRADQDASAELAPEPAMIELPALPELPAIDTIPAALPPADSIGAPAAPPPVTPETKPDACVTPGSACTAGTPAPSTNPIASSAPTPAPAAR